MDEDTALYIEYGKTGNPGLFRQLWDKHKKPVLNTILRITDSSRTEAEDLLQEVFMKVIENRKKFEPKARFSTWLYRLSVNRSFNAVRDRKKTVEADETLEDPNQTRVVDALVAKERQQVLQTAMTQLNERQRGALVLREFEDKSYGEIAEIMESSVEAVESLLFHARTRLRQLLKGREL
ncbi:MAG: sigma-70 family RNA polymerase sigma factor [Fibrobacterota bacterium]